MNMRRLVEILDETSVQLRKGEEIKEETIGGVIDVITIDAMPPVSAARPDLEIVDLEMLAVGVDKTAAETYRDELKGMLQTLNKEMMLSGPSYTTMGAELGDQGIALQLFALGKVLGFWNLITPETFLVKDAAIRLEMAQHGFIMITPFREE